MFVENLQYIPAGCKTPLLCLSAFWPKLTIFLEFIFKTVQWRIQDIAWGGGANSPGGANTQFLPKFPQNCLKSKEFGRRGDAIGAFHRSLPSWGLSHGCLLWTLIWLMNEVRAPLKLSLWRKLWRKRKSLWKYRQNPSVQSIRRLYELPIKWLTK